ncbi:PDZ domain-containing protein [bacterium]|nr:MAG: PDZ domain-containing protein [bacterium]
MSMATAVRNLRHPTSVIRNVTAFALVALSLSLAPAEDFAPAWEKIETSIRQRYYARTARKSDMDRLLAKYGPIVKAAGDRKAFDGAMDSMIAEFRDSHFDFLTPEEQGYYLMDNLLRQDKAEEMPNVGAWFRLDGDGYTVQMVLEDGAAAKAGLRAGDVITSLDGVPFSPVESLKSRVGKTVPLVYRRRGAETTTTIAVSTARPLKMFLEASRASTRVIDQGGRKFGYFHLWTQASDDFRNALSNAIYGRLKDTDAFILDLRGGFGGRPEGFADPFFRPDMKLDWKTTPTAGYSQNFGYSRPLVVLIDKGSRSAKEILSFILQKSKRATLIGETTAGNVLGTSPYRINDWSFLEIPMVDVAIEGVRLEGKGVAPDIAVSQSPSADGKDATVEKAVEVLLKKVGKKD